MKKLQFVNVYESPRDLYIALESFPGVPTECLPPPSTIPTTYPQATSPPQRPSRPTQATSPSQPNSPPQPTSPPTQATSPPQPTSPPTQATSPSQPNSPPPTTTSVPSAQCVLLEPDQTYCRSSDATVILEAQNNGDTSGCTFSDEISWGDGSEQTVQLQGADNVPEVVASHTYEQLGGYGISDAVTVVSGDCTATDGEYTFAYVTG